MKKKYKTKFPVARIKKIMQLDEDVGKVAQATPILISKALELFMQSLIDQACGEARQRGAKRLTVSHLKKTIDTTEQFDFLKDIVANVPDPTDAMEEDKARVKKPKSARVKDE
ncbi:histone-fold-containing protein [Gongronella butleri]|nr:histone-fold-containing protein [Gongronella butleri]